MKSQGRTTATSQPPITLNRWGDLGIGIDEDGQYWAFIPRPGPGTPVCLHEAIRLHLGGWRLKALLAVLAQSEDGRTVSEDGLERRICPSRLLATRTGRGRVGAGRISEGQAVHDEGLSVDEQEGYVRRALRSARADLKRKLLKQLPYAPGKAGQDLPPIVVPVAGEPGECVYRAAFPVRHLLRDGGGGLVFGRGS